MNGTAARTAAPRSAATAGRVTRPVRVGRRAAWGWATTTAAALIAVGGMAACSTNRDHQADRVALTHVHGLGVNPADGKLYVATHDGLYQLASNGDAALVGVGHQDTMGFTIAGPNEFLASGHPAPDEGGPPHLGLIESSDGGLTWTTRSLAGQADFHALRYRHSTVYGYNSTTGQLITSTDKVRWQTRATMSLRDFDVSPTDARTLLATTDNGLQRSTDGGTTWTPAGGPPLLLLTWESTDRLWGIAITGDVLRSADGGHGWVATGKVAGRASAFAVHDGTLFASMDGGAILSSSDEGATWSTVYAQP